MCVGDFNGLFWFIMVDFWVILAILDQMGSFILVTDFNSTFGLQMADFRQYLKFQTKSAQFTL